MRRSLYAVLLVSTAAIAYELLLMRMLSIVQWHHFAWMVISLALLGYGASGTAIALTREWLETRLATAFAATALLFSFSMAACWAVAQRVPFNALEVVWAPRQLLYLGALYLVFMIPFFFAASFIGLTFTFFGRGAPRIYLLDLLGAGCGAALIMAALFVLDAPRALAVLALLPVAAVLLGGADGPLAPGSSVPAFTFPEQAAAVLGRSHAYARWLQEEAVVGMAVLDRVQRRAGRDAPLQRVRVPAGRARHPGGDPRRDRRWG